MDPNTFFDEPGNPGQQDDNIIPFRSGIYDDDGNFIEPMSIPKPGLCIICYYDDDEDELESGLCLLNRFDQRNVACFECGHFMRKAV
jgi:hypothetical protein